MSITKGLENKIKRSVEKAEGYQDITFNWRGEAYRVTFITEQSTWTGNVKVYRQDDELNREMYVGTVKFQCDS